MTGRWSATAKGCALLAVAAATPAWDVTALCLFLILRHQARVWDPASVPAKRAPGQPGAGLLPPIANWRVEIVIALGITAARGIVTRLVGYPLADLTMVAAVAVLLWSPDNRWAHTHLVGLRRRRRWERAMTAVAPHLTPTIVELGADRNGEWATVRVAAGGTVAQLADRADALAAWHAVAEVRVRRDPDHAGLAYVNALRADPLAGPPAVWPGALSATSLWQPISVGIDEDGQRVTMTLFEHNLLVGGEPGAGKSVAVHQIVAAAALDPDAHLWLLDPKLVELAAWAEVADRFVGNDIFDATDTLRHVQTAMDERYRQLLAAGLRKVTPGTPLHLVVVDELAHYLAWPDRKARDAFADLLRDLVSRGRAAGVIVVAATQKPASEVIPTSLRDLFGWRWALRCTTPAASDTVLGAGWATQGVSAASIRPELRGVGFLLHESGQPVRLRAFLMDDTTIELVAVRAAQLRGIDREATGE